VSNFAVLPPRLVLDPLLHAWLLEDIGRGDRTTNTLLADALTPATAHWLAKAPGRIAGLPVAARVFHLLNIRKYIDIEQTTDLSAQLVNFCKTILGRKFWQLKLEARSGYGSISLLQIVRCNLGFEKKSLPKISSTTSKSIQNESLTTNIFPLKVYAPLVMVLLSATTAKSSFLVVCQERIEG
jgi:Quinolinate phosphoribosyl transferase, N-terminal domain